MGSLGFSASSVKRWAILDMGSNTFLLLVAEYDPLQHRIKILRDEQAVTRLGAGVGERGYIQPENVARAKLICLYYNEICASLQVQRLWAIGTAALRRAKNSLDVVKEISSVFQCFHTITILSPEEEACYSYRGALIPAVTATASYLTIDIGGGSTELVWGVGWTPKRIKSFPIGVVSLFEFFQREMSQEAVLGFLKESIQPHLSTFSSVAVDEVYVMAGTPVTIACILQHLPYYEWWRVHGASISYESLEALIAYLWEISIEERRRHPSILPERADVLPVGALLLLEFMRYLKLPSVRVSIYGLRYGALLALLHREVGFDYSLPFSLEEPWLTR